MSIMNDVEKIIQLLNMNRKIGVMTERLRIIEKAERTLSREDVTKVHALLSED